MTIPANLMRRIESLEATVQRQQQVINALSGRDVQLTERRWVYLAKTIRVGEEYPATGNTFGLQFIDREFTPEEGTQSATDHARSATSQAVGRTFSGEYLAEGTPVLAVPAPRPPGTTGKGRWHIVALNAQIKRGVTDEEILKGDSGNVSRYLDGTDDDSGATDEIRNDYIDVGVGKSVMYVTLGGVKYIFDVECPPE